ncbi:MAG: cytochrome c oxidase subunit 3 [Chthoniobacter sp.]|uniref:cytochrome c oxidase subunit 3 n=1 Tax=Chthoniobacter sp. TaxID=2510640 RepID=UPI0032A71614
MEIPHTVTARPDTGLYNAKLAIWLFLASEVMLFGGLFSAYVFLRMGADDGYWPHGLLNVPVGTVNTIILITSSICVVFAWAALKMRRWGMYKAWLGIAILLGAIFLAIKLGYEYPNKFDHFGTFIKKEKWAEYEPYLGNDYLSKKGLDSRPEIRGHLHEVEIDVADADKAQFDALIKARSLEISKSEDGGKVLTVKVHSPRDAEALARVPGELTNPAETDPAKQIRKENGVKMVAFELALDEVNADPTNPKFDKPSFWFRGHTEKLATIHADDVDAGGWGAFVPKHSPFLAIYYAITALHGLHILGGLVCFVYFFFFSEALYRRNPEHMANRIEVVGLYWHFVDLVWIFVFPVFYLL